MMLMAASSWLQGSWAHFDTFVNMLFTDFSSLVHSYYVAPNFSVYGSV